MKVTTPIGLLIFIGLILIIATYIITEYWEPSDTVSIKHRGDYDVIKFKLPNSHDPDVFGPPLWKARHFLAEFTPCSACRIDTVSHEKFYHDWVNKKKGKKIKYNENYDEWVMRICENKTEKSIV